ncbi:MAG: NAD+ synthase [Rhabdochlamydiaceae bacterium]|nr:NAD+ synthase [Candidatus Amphrikana amoebophyrae]
MKIALYQINPIIGDLKGNFEKIANCVEKGRADGADLCLFPELSLCGYPPQDLVLHRHFIDRMEFYLQKLVSLSKGITIVVGTVRRNLGGGEKPFYNSAAVIDDGKILGYQDKWLLPTYDVFTEARYFEPGRHTQIFEIKGVRIGILICEDIWKHAGYVTETAYSRDPVEALKKNNPDILLNLTASPYQYQKPHIRIKVCARSAKTLECPVIYCCQVGANDQLIFDGMSLVVGRDGHLIHQCKGFEEDSFIFDMKKEDYHAQYLSYQSFDNLRYALQLGIKDYFYKSGFQKACIGLSGGIDCAVVATLAAGALGAENVLGIMMPSRYSSEGSVSDAKELAKNLGIKTLEIGIEKPFKAFLETLEETFKGEKENVTEENLQARIRGTILMAISNKFGHIVLSTGNKSEIALGYCTLYGDMCGGLGVIADVAKTQVYNLARWMNREKEIIPQATIDKPPSAELRPNQIDLDTLPDYGIIDVILEGYVEDYLPVEQVAARYGIPIDIVISIVTKIHGSEYKRQQSAPILRVSKKSFGAGRKYPIVNNWPAHLKDSAFKTF